MSDIIGELVGQLTKGMVGKKEAAIRSVLPGGRSIGDDLGRLGMVTTPDGCETYTLDGKPIIKFLPPEFDHESSREITKIVGTIRYQVLGAPPAPNPWTGRREPWC